MLPQGCGSSAFAGQQVGGRVLHAAGQEYVQDDSLRRNGAFSQNEYDTEQSVWVVTKDMQAKHTHVFIFGTRALATWQQWPVVYSKLSSLNVTRRNLALKQCNVIHIRLALACIASCIPHFIKHQARNPSIRLHFFVRRHLLISLSQLPTGFEQAQ